jgi:hypothetical protein
VSLAPRSLRHLPVEESARLNYLVRRLRARGLSHAAIAVVLDEYEGHELTSDHVRAWLNRLGAPKNPNKARPRRPAPSES